MTLRSAPPIQPSLHSSDSTARLIGKVRNRLYFLVVPDPCDWTDTSLDTLAADVAQEAKDARWRRLLETSRNA